MDCCQGSRSAWDNPAQSLEHLLKRFVEEGFPAAIERKKLCKPPQEIQFGGELEAHLLALACSDPLTGKNVGQCGCRLRT